MSGSIIFPLYMFSNLKIRSPRFFENDLIDELTIESYLFQVIPPFLTLTRNEVLSTFFTSKKYLFDFNLPSWTPSKLYHCLKTTQIAPFLLSLRLEYKISPSKIGGPLSRMSLVEETNLAWQIFEKQRKHCVNLTFLWMTHGCFLLKFMTKTIKI